MVFDEPPAPAARVELGFDACEPAALRLCKGGYSNIVSEENGRMRKVPHRIWAPGGFATVLERAESESDWIRNVSIICRKVSVMSNWRSIIPC